MADIQSVDYRNPKHAADLVYLLDLYARDPMGGARPLAPKVKETLTSRLARIPHAFSVIAYEGGKPVALANCFEAFSTFKASPLINIHDIMVHPDYRRQGLSQQLLAKVEEVARARGCCKITLEVLEGNTGAQKSYRAFGFEGYELDPAVGRALFWQKELS